MQSQLARWALVTCIAVSAPRATADALPSSKLSLPPSKEATILFTTGLKGDSTINLTLESGEVTISFSSGEGRILNTAKLVGGNSISFECHAATVKSLSQQPSWGSYTITTPQPANPPKPPDPKPAALDAAAAGKVTTKLKEVREVLAKKPDSGELVKDLVTKVTELGGLIDALLAAPKPAGGLPAGEPTPAGELPEGVLPENESSSR